MGSRKPGPRPAVLGTCSLSPYNIPEGDRQRLEDGLSLVDEMARRAVLNGWRLDLALLPEHFAQGEKDPPSVNCEPLDGRVVSAMARKAREHGTYVGLALRLRDGDVFYNALVMLDRSGELVGVYRKVHPVLIPDGSLEGGIAPGRQYPVWELDFGRVGAQICFDVFFEDGWEALDAKEAELVLFTSATSGVAGVSLPCVTCSWYEYAPGIAREP